MSATLQQSMEAAADTMIDKVGKMVQGRAMAGQDTRAMTAAERANKGNESDDSGVHSDEWDDSDDEERRKLSEQIQKQKAENARLMRSQITRARLDRKPWSRLSSGSGSRRPTRPRREAQADAGGGGQGGAQLEPTSERQGARGEDARSRAASMRRQRREEWLGKVAETEGNVEAKVPSSPRRRRARAILAAGPRLQPRLSLGDGCRVGGHVMPRRASTRLSSSAFWYDLGCKGRGGQAS